MKRDHSGLSKILTFIAGFCFLFPLYIYALWIYAFNTGSLQKERVAIFVNFFPEFLNGKYSIVFLSIFFSVAAILLSITNLTLQEQHFRKINMLLLTGSGLLLLLNLWQLM